MRELGAADARDMAFLHALCFDAPWPETDMLEHLSRDIVLGTGSPVTAMIIIRVAVDQAEILTLATHPDHRSKGLGERLLIAGEQKAGAQGADIMFLEVAEDNAPAIALYKKCAYEVFGRRPAYYKRKGGRVNALMLRKKLDASRAKS